MINVTAENFQREVLEAEGTVLVDFWAPWCGPCKMIGPVLEELEQERPDVRFVKVNVDEEPSLASEFGINSVPSLIVFQKGGMIRKSIGLKPKEELAKIL